MTRTKSVRSRGRLKEAVATFGMLAMAAGGVAGAYLGYRWGGLGVAFLGLLGGGAIGLGVVFFLTNVVRRNSKFFSVLATLVIIGLIAWALHALGLGLGLDPK